jgi:OOP family OmpA-OmpF porin
MIKSNLGRLLGAALIVGATTSGSAFAQSNPTADQIINSLKPTGQIGDTTRGIKPIGPGSEPSMAPSSAPSPMSGPSGIHIATASPSPRPSTNLTVVFESGSADLTPQATVVLNNLGQALTSAQLADYNFKIIGHTDTMGTATANQSLSEQRAEAVKTYLQTKFGVSDARLVAVGDGESDLLVPTPPQTAELQNRRVQIVNIGK